MDFNTDTLVNTFKKLTGGRLAPLPPVNDLQKQYLAQPVIPAMKVEDTIRMCVQSETRQRPENTDRYFTGRPKQDAFPDQPHGSASKDVLVVAMSTFLTEDAAKFIPPEHLVRGSCGYTPGYVYTAAPRNDPEKISRLDPKFIQFTNWEGHINNGVLSLPSEQGKRMPDRSFIQDHNDRTTGHIETEGIGPVTARTTGLASWSESNTMNSGLRATDHLISAGAAALETLRDMTEGTTKAALLFIPGPIDVLFKGVDAPLMVGWAAGIKQAAWQAPQDAYFAGAHAVLGVRKLFESDDPYKMSDRLKAYSGPIPGVYGRHEGPVAPNMGALYDRTKLERTYGYDPVPAPADVPKPVPKTSVSTFQF